VATKQTTPSNAGRQDCLDPAALDESIEAMRAAAWLMDYLTEAGNVPLDGRIAQGFAQTLLKISGDVELIFRRVRRSGLWP
jgi:hypothetical protein